MTKVDEDWERTKYILTSRLLEDVNMSRLTFSEEESSSDDSQENSSYSLLQQTYLNDYEFSKHDDTKESGSTISKHSSSRESWSSYSPLPPSLVVEIETNKHDDPEEFYTQLEMRMKHYYRMIFFGEESDDGSGGNRAIEQEVDVNESNTTPEYGYGSPLQITYIGNGNVRESDESSYDGDRVDLDVVEIANADVYEEVSPKASTKRVKCREYITRAQIHRAPSMMETDQSLIFENLVKSPILEPSKRVGRLDCESDTLLEENIHPDKDQEKFPENDDIEVMRGQETQVSREMQHDDSIVRGIRFSDAENNIGLIEDFNSNVQMDVIGQMEAHTFTQTHFDDNIGSSSTPKSNDRKRRYEHAPADSKKKKFNNIATQTSLEEDSRDLRVDFDVLRSNVFIGVPRIYKLCPCRNHVCAR